MLKPFPCGLVLYPMTLKLFPFMVSESPHLRDQLQELAGENQIIQLISLESDFPFRSIPNP